MGQVPIEGTYWAGDRLLAGPYPGHADAAVAVARLEALQAAGIALFVDLTTVGEAPPYAPLLRGVRHERRPIPDFGTVTPGEYATVLDLVDDALQADEAVYVHCLGGLGRTGTVVGCWLARHGRDAGDPVARIAELRRGLPDALAASPQTAEQCAVVRGWQRGQ